MTLAKLCTAHNLAIFSALSEEEGSIRELAERTGSSPAKVLQAIKLFKEQGLINERKQKNRRVISLKQTHPLTRQLKALFNLDQMLSAKSIKALKKVGELRLYGSYAEGSDDAESDVDLLILTAKSEMGLRPRLRALEKELGRKVSALVMNDKEMEKLKAGDPEFANRLRQATTL